jgi:hypothetical protein
MSSQNSYFPLTVIVAPMCMPNKNADSKMSLANRIRTAVFTFASHIVVNVLGKTPNLSHPAS